MTTKVEQKVHVKVPVDTAYNQWTQFEQFPKFMGGVKEVTQLDDSRVHWVAEIGGVKREWDASIVEQVPNQKIAWAALEGATNAGAVLFTPTGADETDITLVLEYEPEGFVEAVGDKLGVVESQAESDLAKFKELIESQGFESGAWRGSINSSIPEQTPDISHAAASQGDDGKAGLSSKAVAGAAVVGAAAAVAGVAASRSSESSSDDSYGDSTATSSSTLSESSHIAGQAAPYGEAGLSSATPPTTGVPTSYATGLDTSGTLEEPSVHSRDDHAFGDPTMDTGSADDVIARDELRRSTSGDTTI